MLPPFSITLTINTMDYLLPLSSLGPAKDTMGYMSFSVFCCLYYLNVLLCIALVLYIIITLFTQRSEAELVEIARQALNQIDDNSRRRFLDVVTCPFFQDGRNKHAILITGFHQDVISFVNAVSPGAVIHSFMVNNIPCIGLVYTRLGHHDPLAGLRKLPVERFGSYSELQREVIILTSGRAVEAQNSSIIIKQVNAHLAFRA